MTERLRDQESKRGRENNNKLHVLAVFRVMLLSLLINHVCVINWID